MATKKDAPKEEPKEETAQVVGDAAAQVEEKRKRREDAVTVDGSESPSSADEAAE